MTTPLLLALTAGKGASRTTLSSTMRQHTKRGEKILEFMAGKSIYGKGPMHNPKPVENRIFTGCSLFQHRDGQKSGFKVFLADLGPEPPALRCQASSPLPNLLESVRTVTLIPRQGARGFNANGQDTNVEQQPACRHCYYYCAYCDDQRAGNRQSQTQSCFGASYAVLVRLPA